MAITQIPALGRALPALPLASGRYYSSPLVNTLATFTHTLNVLYAIPFHVPYPATFTSINIEVTTLGSGNHIRLGIYNDNNGVPGSLVLDAGTVLTTTTGGKSIVINQTLVAGWYWLASVSDSSTPVVRAISQSTASPDLGFTSGTDTTFHVGWSVAFTYAALPDPFTGGGALMTTAAPRIMLGL